MSANVINHEPRFTSCLSSTLIGAMLLLLGLSAQAAIDSPDTVEPNQAQSTNTTTAIAGKIALPQLSPSEFELARKAYLLIDKNPAAAKALIPKLNPDHVSTAILLSREYEDKRNYLLVASTLEKYKSLYRQGCSQLPADSKLCEMPRDGHICNRIFMLSGEANFWLKKYDEAIDDLTSYVQFHNKNCNQYELRPSALRSLGASYYYLKKYPEALDTLLRGYKLLPAGLHRAEYAYNIAVVHALMGNTDESLKWLAEPLASEDKEYYYSSLPKDHDFDGMRNDERFKALLKERPKKQNAAQ